MPDLVQVLLTVAPPTALLLEAVRRCPFRRLSSGAVRAGRKSMRLLASDRISARWKEKALLAYSGTLARHSLGLGALVALLAGGFVAALHLSGRLWQPGFDATAALTTTDHLVAATVVAAGTLALRHFLSHG